MERSNRIVLIILLILAPLAVIIDYSDYYNSIYNGGYHNTVDASVVEYHRSDYPDRINDTVYNVTYKFNIDNKEKTAKCLQRIEPSIGDTKTLEVYRLKNSSIYKINNKPNPMYYFTIIIFAYAIIFALFTMVKKETHENYIS